MVVPGAFSPGERTCEPVILHISLPMLYQPTRSGHQQGTCFSLNFCLALEDWDSVLHRCLSIEVARDVPI